jgi:hypothetical protein
MLYKIFLTTCGQGTVTANSTWRPVALFTRQNGNLRALFTRQYFSVVADRPPSPILKITFDASKVALLAGSVVVFFRLLDATWLFDVSFVFRASDDLLFGKYRCLSLVLVSLL